MHMRMRHPGRGGRHARGPWVAARFWFSPRGRGPSRPPFGRGGPFGRDPFDGDAGPRFRQRRGDIRYALLELVAEQPRHGYELIKALEQRYGGFYRPSPGSVYPTLQLLEEQGHLVSGLVDGKRVYTITESGTNLLAEHRAAGPHGRERRGPWGGEAMAELGGLRESAMALLDGIMQVVRHGRPGQIRAVQQILEKARREVYGLLAHEQADDVV